MGEAGVNIWAHASTHMHISQESRRRGEKHLLNPIFCNDDILHNIFKSRRVTLHTTLTQVVGFARVSSVFTVPLLYLSVYSSMKFYCLCALLNYQPNQDSELF